MRFRQTQSFDRILGEMTFARACTASRDYVLVRVPYSGEPRESVTLHTANLSEADRRFVLDDITPNEHLVAIGELKPEKLDRSR